MLVAFAGAPGAAFARGLVVARAELDPAGSVPVAEEPVHVHAELGDDHLRRQGPDPGNRVKPLNLLDERDQTLIDLVGQRRDLLLEEIQVRELIDQSLVDVLAAQCGVPPRAPRPICSRAQSTKKHGLNADPASLPPSSITRVHCTPIFIRRGGPPGP